MRVRQTIHTEATIALSQKMGMWQTIVSLFVLWPDVQVSRKASQTRGVYAYGTTVWLMRNR